MNPFLLFVIVAIAFTAGLVLGRRSHGIAIGVGVPGARRVHPVSPVPMRASHNGYSFTDGVRSALSQARKQASSLGHPYVGAEHILLGLLHDLSGVPARVFQRLRIDPAAVRAAIVGSVKPGGTSAGPDLPYTSRAKRVLEMAMTQARDLSHDYVGTEHLLLGIVVVDGLAAQVLADAGADAESVRRETIAALLEPDPGPGAD